MNNFGSYNPVRKIQQSLTCSTFCVQKDQAEQPVFTLKAFTAPAYLSQQQTQEDIQVFLDSATIQKDLSDKHADYWPTFYEIVSDEETAYVVRDYYDLSAQDLLQGKSQLPQDRLYKIIHAVAKGLKELQDAYARPHGNLKAANILIKDNTDFLKSKIALCDPVSETNAPNKNTQDDLFALGTLLYQLVTHTPFDPSYAQATIEDSKHWRRFGKNSKKWQHLTEQLLQSKTSAQPPTLESILEFLEALKIPKQSRTPMISAGCLILVILAAVSFFVVNKVIENKRIHEKVKTGWNVFCNEYILWIEPFATHYNKLDNDAKTAMEIQTLNDELEKTRYPRQLQSLNSVRWESIPTLFNPDSENSPTLKNVDKIKAHGAIEAANAIKLFFGINENSTDSIPSWPVLKDLDQSIDTLNKIGLNNYATYLEEHIQTVASNPPENLWQHVTSVYEDYHLLESIPMKNFQTLADQKPLDPSDSTPETTKLIKLIYSRYATILSNSKIDKESFTTLPTNLSATVKSLGLAKDTLILFSQIQQRIRSVNNPNDPRVLEFNSAGSTFENDLPTITSTKDMAERISAFHQAVNEIGNKFESDEKWAQKARQAHFSDNIIKTEWTAYIETFLSSQQFNSTSYNIDFQTRNTMDTVKKYFLTLDKSIVLWKPVIEIQNLPKDNSIFKQLLNDELNTKIHTCTQSIKTHKIALLNLIKTQNPDQSNIEQFQETIAENKRQYDSEKEALKSKLDELSSNLTTFEDHLNQIITEIESFPSYETIQKILADYQTNIEDNIDTFAPVGKKVSGIVTQTIGTQIDFLKSVYSAPTKTELFSILPPKNTSLRKYQINALWKKIEQFILDAPDNLDEYETEQTLSNDHIAFLEQQEPAPEIISLTNEIITAGTIQKTRRTLKNWTYSEKTTHTTTQNQIEQFTKACRQKLNDHTDFKNPVPAQRILEFIQQVDTHIISALDGIYTLNEHIQTYIPFKENEKDIEQSYQTANLEFNKLNRLLADIDDTTVLSTLVNNYQNTADHYQDILKRLKPPMFKRMQRDDKDRIVFKSDNAILNDFIPLDIQKKPITKTSTWPKENLVFYDASLQDTNEINYGWPKYIGSTKDNTVVFAFVPGNGTIPPFYMSADEINFAQYTQFLKQNDIVYKDSRTYTKFTLSANGSKHDIIYCQKKHYYHLDGQKYTYDITQENNIYSVADSASLKPVNFVTFEGARQYADWLKTQLPTETQHKYASNWNNGSLPNNAHLRGVQWKQFVNEHNAFIDRIKNNEIESLIANFKYAPPMGIMDSENDPSVEIIQITIGNNVQETITIKTTETFSHNGGDFFPYHHTTAVNQYGLSNLIGNVWEWCTDGNTNNRLCGLSCLSPTQPQPYTIEPPQNKTTAIDVGFRIVLNLPDTN